MPTAGHQYVPAVMMGLGRSGIIPHNLTGLNNQQGFSALDAHHVRFLIFDRNGNYLNS
jgi:hypothetical protein